MLARGLMVLLMLAFAGCGPAPTAWDAGDDRQAVPDAGSVDAGSVDAGSVDAGSVDAGSVDAGSVDAGSGDAGSVDAGSVDAGFVDAGSGDAGSSDAGFIDAGSPDAGAAHDAGTPLPEACNGLDDDLDGVVDGFADGGVLRAACPLTAGVCAGASSACRDGGWTLCDYGPDYQLTEHRCDGLDNDCDGVVDSSWARVLLTADAGRYPARPPWHAAYQLLGADIEAVQRANHPGGHWLSLPNDLLILDDELRLAQRVEFPLLEFGHAGLLVAGTASVRAASELTRAGNRYGLKVLFHRVHADAGFDLLPDGGLVVEGSLDLEDAGVPAFQTDIHEGWTNGRQLVTVVQHPPNVPRLLWASLQEDAGLSTGEVDVKALNPSSFLTVHHGGPSVFVANQLSGGLDVYDLDLPVGTLTPVLSVSGSACTVATSAPLTVQCGSPLATWSQPGVGVLAPPFEGYAARETPVNGDLLAWMVRPGADAGTGASTLAVVRDGGLLPIGEAFPFSTLDPEYGRNAIYQEVHPVSGRLLLITSATHITSVCPACDVESFFARYVCLPP